MTPLSRRGFLGTIAAIPVLGKLIAQDTYGFVDVERADALGIWPCRVFVDGVEIDDCLSFNDREGWAEYFVIDAHDQYIYSRPIDGYVTGRRRGHVTVQPRSIHPGLST